MIDMHDRLIIGSLLVSILSVLVPLGQGQLDINGGFESAAVDPGSWKYLEKDNTQINGWIVGGNGIDLIGGLWQPSEGSRSIDLSAYSAGTINTTLNTVPGTTYRLLFDMAGNPGGEPYVKALRVWIDDKSQKFTFDTTGKTAENMGWQTNSLDFTATSSTTKLAFESLTDSSNGPALDNVRVSIIGKTNNNNPNPNMDLTGVWSCDDSGTYYIRQIGSIVWWDGEQDTANPSWANVARGTINGNTVTLDYADVPETDASGYGTLILDIISNDELKAKEKPDSYGGSRWVRSSNKNEPPINSPATAGTGSTSTIPGSTTMISGTQGSLNPWDDLSIRQLIDEWLMQQDNCAKKVYPSAYIDKWGRLCGDTGGTTISCVLLPEDRSPDWDNYHYLWYYNRCCNYYPYRVQDYVNLRQSGSSFDDLAKCKGWYDGCY